jgi:hypothetical protein
MFDPKKNPKDGETGHGSSHKLTISESFDCALSIAAHDNVPPEAWLRDNDPHPLDPETGKGTK